MTAADDSSAVAGNSTSRRIRNEFGARPRSAAHDIPVPIPPASLPLPPAARPITHHGVDPKAAAAEQGRVLAVIDALLPVAMVALLLIALSLFWGA